MNELVKKNVVFRWDDVYDRAFKTLKYILTNASLLSLPNFDKAFEIECDAYGTEIGAVLMLDSKPNTYFSENLSGFVDPQFCPSTLAFILWVSHSPIVLI